MIRLINSDCLIALPNIESGSVDMVLADLPYGTTACKWDMRIPFEPLWKELHRICKPNAAMAMFGSEPFSSLMRISNLKRFKYDWVWDKRLPSGFQIAKFRPMQRHETISIFGGSNYFPIKILQKTRTGKIYGKSESSPLSYDDGKLKTYTEKNPQSILDFYKRDSIRFHPTQKPVALLEYLIKTYTKKGDTVLDPTMGSGSTGVACKNLGRRFIGIEMDENYFNIAQKRLNQL